MKKILFIAFLFVSIGAFAFASQEVEAEQLPFFKFVLGFLASIGTTLLAFAVKHFLAGQWSWSQFWEGNLKPLLFSVAGAIVLIAVQYFIPQYQFLVEEGLGGTLDLNTDNLLLLGAGLTAIIKAYFDSQRLKEKK